MTEPNSSTTPVLAAGWPLVIPHAEGAVTAQLLRLEEYTLALLPEGLVDGREVDHLGHLIARISEQERHPEPVQPVAPNGRLELGPLCLVAATARQRLAAATLPARLGRVDEDTIDRGDHHQALDTAQRFAALITGPPHLDDLGAITMALSRAPGTRVVLDADQYAAYQRVTAAILTGWYANDPLAGYALLGSASVGPRAAAPGEWGRLEPGPGPEAPGPGL